MTVFGMKNTKDSGDGISRRDPENREQNVQKRPVPARIKVPAPEMLTDTQSEVRHGGINGGELTAEEEETETAGTAETALAEIRDAAGTAGAAESSFIGTVTPPLEALADFLGEAADAVSDGHRIIPCRGDVTYGPYFCVWHGRKICVTFTPQQAWICAGDGWHADGEELFCIIDRKKSTDPDINAVLDAALLCGREPIEQIIVKMFCPGMPGDRLKNDIRKDLLAAAARMTPGVPAAWECRGETASSGMTDAEKAENAEKTDFSHSGSAECRRCWTKGCPFCTNC